MLSVNTVQVLYKLFKEHQEHKVTSLWKEPLLLSHSMCLEIEDYTQDLLWQVFIGLVSRRKQDFNGHAGEVFYLQVKYSCRWNPWKICWTIEQNRTLTLSALKSGPAKQRLPNLNYCSQNSCSRKHWCCNLLKKKEEKLRSHSNNLFLLLCLVGVSKKQTKSITLSSE